MNKKIKKLILILFLSKYINCIDNPHFYRANHYFSEPRLKKDWLTTIDIWAAGGKTVKGIDFCGFKTNILNIFGTENIRDLTKNVPRNILDKDPNSIINNLWAITDPRFGRLKYKSYFSTFELAFNYQQNFLNGLFIQLYFPVRKLEIKSIRYFDLSTKDEAPLDFDFRKYQKYITNLCNNLTTYGINFNKNFSRTGIGDTTLLCGWTTNYEDTEYLDYIDATLRLGILFPTGKEQNINNVFDLPQGYNGFFAIPLLFEASFGVYNWLTLGCHAGSLFFISKTKKLRMKTALDQNGFIKLTTGKAKVNQGTIWNVGLYAKADHVWYGLSFFLGYRFDKQQRTKLEPYDNKTFKIDIVNSDRILHGWQMHSLSIMAEYDFATYDSPNLPRIYAFIDLPLKGKQIFKTKMIGSGIAVDYSW